MRCAKANTSASPRIELLAEHIDMVKEIAAWHWGEWGHLAPDASLAGWTEQLRLRARRSGIPICYVAVIGEAVVGTCLLVEHDMRTHPELSPWLAGVYVLPGYRRQGIASAIVRHAMTEAEKLGVTRLYLHTETAPQLYAQLGWDTLSTKEFEGQQSTVMTVALSGV